MCRVPTSLPRVTLGWLVNGPAKRAVWKPPGGAPIEGLQLVEVFHIVFVVPVQEKLPSAGVGVGVAVAVGVNVAVAVAVGVGVNVAVAVGVGLNVLVGVAVGVEVGVEVAVGVGVGEGGQEPSTKVPPSFKMEEASKTKN